MAPHEGRARAGLCAAQPKEKYPMNINRFGAILLAAIVAALPVHANNGGGKGGGGVSERLLEQQQQQQEEEQIPEAAAPAPTESILDSLEEPTPAPDDSASLAARDFYSKVVTHLDTAIAQQKEKLKALDARIAGIDHKLAADFTDTRAGDKTTDDAIESAKQTLDSMPKPKVYNAAVTGNLQMDLASTSFADKDLVAATEAIVDFKATAASIKVLEAARADMAAAAKAYGATIN
jgi:hypothetical protein